MEHRAFLGSFSSRFIVSWRTSGSNDRPKRDVSMNTFPKELQTWGTFVLILLCKPVNWKACYANWNLSNWRLKKFLSTSVGSMQIRDLSFFFTITIVLTVGTNSWTLNHSVEVLFYSLSYSVKFFWLVLFRV